MRSASNKVSDAYKSGNGIKSTISSALNKNSRFMPKKDSVNDLSGHNIAYRQISQKKTSSSGLLDSSKSLIRFAELVSDQANGASSTHAKEKHSKSYHWKIIKILDRTQGAKFESLQHETN